MTKNLLIGLLVLAIAVGGGYFLARSNTPAVVPEPVAMEQVDATPTLALYKFPLEAQNDSAQTGTATFVEADGKVKVVLQLSGIEADVSQPAHIHLGACPDVTDVKYPLEPVLNGVSETVLDVTLAQLKSELPLGVNVHKSTTEANVYVACGDLRF